MISVEARIYRGKPWLLIREWDGYDHVNWDKVCEISENELNFAGGRFERMTNNYEATKFKFKIEIFKNKENNPNDIITWIHNNIKGLWNFDITDNFWQDDWLFLFKNAEDAVAFKLRWIG